jgi:serine/threonine-protein kinase
VGAVRRVYHDTAPEGSVIRQEPTGGKAPRGSAVDLWVSRGHAPVAVPEVVRQTQADAEAALRDAGFSVVVQTAFSDRVDRGLVMEVSPAQGEEAPFDSAVTITVSLGPEEFHAPTLTGLTPEDAESKAAGYGLEVTYFYIPGSAQSIVIGQGPEPGETVHYGDTITLFVA